MTGGPAHDPPGALDAAGATAPGRRRAANGDQYLIAHLHRSLLVARASLRLDDGTRLFSSSRGHLMMVADGAGDHGHEASRIAVDFAARYVLESMRWSPASAREHLGGALRRAQEAVLQLSRRNPERRGMGSTLTMALTIWPRLFVAHAGTSRAYLLRDATLRLLTSVDVGSNAVVGAGSDELRVDALETDLRIGDAVLLCSRGLTVQVRDDAIRDILLASRGAEDACRRLVATARELGTEDDVTAIVAYVRPTDNAARVPAQLRHEDRPDGAAV